MNYQEIPASHQLSAFVKCFWEFENKEDHTEYNILPDGCFDLVVELKNGKFDHARLTGVWTKPKTVTIAKGSRLMGVRFKPLASEYIFCCSIHPWVDHYTPIAGDLMGINRFAGQDLRSFSEAFSYYCFDVMDQGKISRTKFELFEQLYHSKGELSVRQLSEKVRWSSRQINRYFNNQFGFSLKTFSDILKCHSSFPQIAKGNLYPEKKYFDQAHFIKQVKQYTGVTPKVLYRNEGDRFLQFSTLQGK